MSAREHNAQKPATISAIGPDAPLYRRLLSTDAGCIVDGHWGQYGVARAIEIAHTLGYNDEGIVDIAQRHLAAMLPSQAPDITDDEHALMFDAFDEMESWLNEHVAPENYSFGWYDGEWFLQSAEWWQQA